MSNVYKYIFLFFIIFLIDINSPLYGADNFKQQLGEHFVVYSDPAIDSQWAKDVLRKAERYYVAIANTVGYARYQNFWTWDERVKIIIYADQKSYMEETHQPSWSTGFVLRDYRLFSSRVIVSYLQESDFLTNVLPHEISHLILRDFIGTDKEIPLWLDEGLAQYFEDSRRSDAERIVKLLVGNQKQLPLSELFTKDIKEEKEEWRVLQFYAQSISLVDFLISKYGSQSFGELCRYLKNDRDFEGALKGAYNPMIDSTQSLEQKWLNFIRNSLKKD